MPVYKGTYGAEPSRKGSGYEVARQVVDIVKVRSSHETGTRGRACADAAKNLARMPPIPATAEDFARKMPKRDHHCSEL
jgi:hypothetical protein